MASSKQIMKRKTDYQHPVRGRDPHLLFPLMREEMVNEVFVFPDSLSASVGAERSRLCRAHFLREWILICISLWVNRNPDPEEKRRRGDY